MNNFHGKAFAGKSTARNGSRKRREPQANGVTGVGRFHWKPACFVVQTSSGIHIFEIIQPPHTSHSDGAAFPAAINHLAVYFLVKA